MKRSPNETRGTLEHFRRYRWKELNKRTINGTQSKRLARPGNRSYLRKSIRLEMTRDEFYGWCTANWNVIKSIYEKNQIPSIDRIDANKHYSLDSIQILELIENIKKKSY